MGGAGFDQHHAFVIFELVGFVLFDDLSFFIQLRIRDRGALSRFGKQGFELTFTVSKDFADEAAVRVGLHNVGNFDTRTLPRMPEAPALYGEQFASGYVAPASVADAADWTPTH